MLICTYTPFHFYSIVSLLMNGSERLHYIYAPHIYSNTRASTKNDSIIGFAYSKMINKNACGTVAACWITKEIGGPRNHALLMISHKLNCDSCPISLQRKSIKTKK